MPGLAATKRDYTEFPQMFDVNLCLQSASTRRPPCIAGSPISMSHVEDGQVVEHGLQFLLPQKKYMGKTLQKRQSGCFFSHSVRASVKAVKALKLPRFSPTFIRQRSTTEITSPEAADSSHMIPFPNNCNVTSNVDATVATQPEHPLHTHSLSLSLLSLLKDVSPLLLDLN